MTNYPEILPHIDGQYHWLVTGAGGFIGSHLTEALLSLGQKVTGIDNFSTGYRHNIDMAITASGRPENFAFTEGSIESPETCAQVMNGVDYVLHHAAFVSVPASMSPSSPGKVFNIGCGMKTTLNELLRMIYGVFAPGHEVIAEYQPPREGDIVHSSASIDYAREVLGYEPAVYLEQGLEAMK